MDLALDIETNDLIMVNGDLAHVVGNDAVAQFTGSLLRTNLSEWFLDEQRGFPYFDLVFKKNPDLVAIDAALKNYILAGPGVIELLEFELTLDSPTRTLSLAFAARSRDGIFTFSDKLGA